MVMWLSLGSAVGVLLAGSAVDGGGAGLRLLLNGACLAAIQSLVKGLAIRGGRHSGTAGTVVLRATEQPIVVVNCDQ
jgi:hypothetical protein